MFEIGTPNVGQWHVEVVVKLVTYSTACDDWHELVSECRLSVNNFAWQGLKDIDFASAKSAPWHFSLGRPPVNTERVIS